MFDYNLYLAIAVHNAGEQAVITFGTYARVSRKGGTWLP
jgi:hypothetical protein